MSLFAKKFFYGIVLALAALVMWGCEQSSPNPSEDITWTAQADGGEAAPSTKINFVFSEAVADLTAAQIIVIDDSGEVTKGALSGGGANWSLGITVIKEGNLIVRINRDGLDSGEKTVAVHEDPIIHWTAQANGADGAADSTAIAFTFDKTVAALTADDIEITPITGSVTKAALTGSGTTRSLGITVGTGGTVKVRINKAGFEAAEKTVAVYKAGQFTDLSWTAQVDGAAGTMDSTYIDFAFSDVVTGLTVGDIIIADDAGSAVKGALTGNGTAWRLGIAVEVAGDVKVSINKPGIENTARKVMLHKTGQNALISWEAEVDGTEGAADSTVVSFAFSGAVIGLSANNIAIVNEGGSVTRGAMTGGGTNWTLGITVNTAGNLKIRIINIEGIENTERTITVHKAPDVLYNAVADGSATATSTAITFTFESPVTGLTASNITVTDDTGSVIKGALTGSGTARSLAITVNAAGNVKVAINKAGIEAAEKTVAVYKAALPNNDITYSAAANGSATVSSTRIDFAFSRAVAELSADNITVAAATGSVTKGALTGSGASRSLAITVDTAGEVKVSIDKGGIDAAEKTVTVQKFVPPPPAAYTAVADGNAETTSAKIDFEFDKAVTGLTAAQISVTNDTGVVSKGSLTGSGASYSLGITVVTAGNVKVTISNSGIDAAEKTVAVRKAPDIAYTATADGGATATSTKIDFVFGKAVEGLTASNITIANGTGRVATGALTGSGTNWSLAITGVAAAGNVTVRINREGIEAAERTVAVRLFIPVAYTVSANGVGNTTASTAIAFVFDTAVTGLTADQITLTAGTGAATKGELTGAGTAWSLGIAVTRPGYITVAIRKAEVETEGRSLAVHAAPNAANPIAYTATTNGNAGANSTLIRFSFAAEVAGLVVGDITVAGDTGSVTTGALTGSGTSWSLAIVVNTVGNVKVKITKTGIEAAEKTVEVFSVIGYTAMADGSVGSASAKIDFVFGESVDSLGLSVNDISITNGTGTAVKGELSGNGANRSLAIGVTRAGTVSVRINKAGIEAATKTVTVHAIGYTATADGDADTTSTTIDFVFTGAVADLTAEDISITNGTGSAVKGELSGSETAWSLGITDIGVTGPGATSGTVRVRINKAGIEDAEKTVTVHKPLEYTDAVQLGQTSGSADVNIGFPEENGAETTIAIDATEKGAVYFIAAKAPAQTIAPTGEANVTVHTSGEVDGETASGALAVIEVKTGILPFDGGTSYFDLIVKEDGKLDRTVHVELEIKTLKTGSAVFKALRPAGQTYANGDDNAVLERVGGNFTTFEAAVTWVESNAEADTEYLVRVENDDRQKMYVLAFNMKENVTLRLRGSKSGADGEKWTRILYHDNSATRVNISSLLRGEAEPFIQIGGENGESGESFPKRTLILDSNISLEGVAAGYASPRYRALIYVGLNATLVLRPGAAIKNFTSGTAKKSTFSPIVVGAPEDLYNFNREHSGRVRLEGGSITDCKVDNNTSTEEWYGETPSNLITFLWPEYHYAIGSFYKAKGVVFSGNVNFSGEKVNEVCFDARRLITLTTRYDLVDGEMSLPAE